jgi:hypothetical protein
LKQIRHELLQTAQSVPVNDRETVFLGIWSLYDLLAHLAGWDFTNLQAIPEVLSSRIPSFYAYRDRDWVTYNALLVAKYKCDSFDVLVDRVQDSHGQLMTALQAVTPVDFGRDFGVRFRGYKVTIQRLLEAETKDEQVHCRQILEFFKDPG